MSLRRVVVTGLGAVTPLGVGLRRSWKRLLAGDCGIVSLADQNRDPRFKELPSQVAAVVPEKKHQQDGGWDATDWLSRDEERKTAKFTQYAIAAAGEALEDANWKSGISDDDKAMTGVCLGSGIGNFDEMYDTSIAYNDKGYKKVSPLFVPKLLINLGAGHLSLRHGFTGPNHAVTTACTTGAHSIGDAARFIACGDANLMLAGGSESCIHPLVLAGFARCRSLATAWNHAPTLASRPFDKARAGFVVGEGAGVLVLEELGHALARGARIYAEVRGYGCSADSFHITAPRENGAGAEMAMARALRQARKKPREVDYINAHATSTPIGDRAENAAIQRLMLGEDGKRFAEEINVSSTKGAVGHLLGGAGALEAAFSVMAIHENTMPPTINLEEVEDTKVFGCNYVAGKAQQGRVNTVLTNSFGFGGTNSSLCFSRYSGGE